MIQNRHTSLNTKSKKQILLNFDNEIKLYNNIQEINNKIELIHNEFLGNK
jgi:hypothetical protein